MLREQIGPRDYAVGREERRYRILEELLSMPSSPTCISAFNAQGSGRLHHGDVRNDLP
ncbi:hypothetical protein HNQ71_006984 [Mesorhizobium sangaii]|uniref:Uncharacterized protein n=1 Tax=Mesorhizobium sangaii TaxID=505389 RepID=A0A841PZ79_9HYPH|nr:hypothetical protein [Mesorhizobium sangaii]